jgi:DNA repair protein RadD
VSYALRGYQAAAVHAGVTFLSQPQSPTKPRHGLIVAPTGSGKALIIANLATQLGGRTIVFQPTKEILEQNAEKLLSYGYAPSVWSASMGEKTTGQITLATIGSVVNDVAPFAGTKYVIVDEAHLVGAVAGTMYRQFFEKLQGAKILGLTATPYRLTVDGYGGAILKFLTRTRPRVFTDVLHVTQTGDLFRQGFLAPLEYHRVPGFYAGAVKRNTTGSDFDDESLKAHLKATAFSARLERVVRRLLTIGRQHVLVFTRYVDEAEELATAFSGQAEVVTGETGRWERAALITDFKAGKLKVIANVGVLGLGFDFPELDTVVLAHPTLSLTKYYQQVGRAVRPSPGKSHGMIVDMVGNVDQFGKIEDLKLVAGGKGGEQWAVWSGDTQLTNTYLGAPRTSRRRR